MASTLVPLFVVAGLMLGPAATANAAAPAVRQASVTTALPQSVLPAGAGVATGVQASTSSQVQVTTGDKKKDKKKSKKKKGKKGGFLKTLIIIVLVVIVLLVLAYGIRMALRRRSG
ncbi:hypothetical protein ACWGDE_13120 [Streptomyces sp. NPDC054956]